MKTFYFILIAIVLCSCNAKQEQKEGKPNKKESLVFTMPEDSIGKATAVIWIDKNDKKDRTGMVTRVLKAQVNVTEDGKISVIQYVKNYPKEAQSYIKHKLLKYEVDKVMMEEGYIKPGVQFMQFRYMPELMLKHDYLYK